MAGAATGVVEEGSQVGGALNIARQKTRRNEIVENFNGRRRDGLLSSDTGDVLADAKHQPVA